MEFLNNIRETVFLGPGGSYTEMAKDIFVKHYELFDAIQTPMKTIKSVVSYIANNPDAIGVLPIENSIEGTIRETVDCIIKSENPDLKILAEVTVPVKHCLISKNTEIYNISGIIAHPKAIEQCKKFIEEEMPRNLDIIETESTEETARQLQNYNLTYAAIGSEKTAETYFLNILRDNINDEQDNQSKFILIGNFKTPQTGHDNTMVAFSTEDKPGSLVGILQIFSKYNVNLTHIDSRPSTNFAEYIVLADFEGHEDDKEIKPMIDELKKSTKYYKNIGSYEKI